MMATLNAGAVLSLCAPLLLCSVGAAYAQSASESTSSTHAEEGVPITDLIATVAKKTGKKFVLDPRVNGNIVIIGQSPTSVSYNDLVTILAVHFYIAVETDGYVEVLPEAAARQEPLPVLTGKESYPDSEFVSKVITPKNIPAAQLVPILRPMLPQNAHLAAFPYNNKLLLVASYANVKRLVTIIDAMDVGEPYKADKSEPPPTPPSSK